MGHEEHRKEAPRQVRVFVLTASDTRGEAEDESGRFLREAAVEPGTEKTARPCQEPATARDSMVALPISWNESIRKSSPNPSMRVSRIPETAS